LDLFQRRLFEEEVDKAQERNTSRAAWFENVGQDPGEV
jgi:hypothetical protein